MRASSFSRRDFLKLAGFAAGSAVATACSAPPAAPAPSSATTSEGTASATTAPAANTDVTTISIMYWDPFMKTVVDAFNKKNPNIKAEFQQVPFDDAHRKLLTSLAAGAGAPDVSGIAIDFIGPFASKGGTVDLTKEPFNAKDYQANLVEYPWIQATSADGRLVAMPWDIGPSGIFYRKDLFEAAGLESDPEKLQAQIKTWDDWLALGEKLKKATPDVALMTDAFVDVAVTMVEQQGHGWIVDDKVQFEEKSIRPLQMAIKAKELGLDLGLDWWSPEYFTAIKDNKVASIAISSWMQGVLLNNAPDTAGKWGVIRAPEGDYNRGGSFLAIPEQSKNKEAAFEFIKFAALSAEGQNAIFGPSGRFPALKTAWEDPLYNEPVEFFGGQKVFQLWKDVANNVPANVVHGSDLEANDIWNTWVGRVKKEGMDPVQAMRDAEAEAVSKIEGITA